MITVLACLICFVYASAQNAETYFEKGLDKAQQGELKEALELFGKSIALDSTNFIVWHFRGILRMEFREYEEALEDFNQAIKLDPYYKYTWLNRAFTKRKLTDYEGAVSDYTHAISIDLNYADAYYFRAFVYQLQGMNDNACADFLQAKLHGNEHADMYVEKCEKNEVSANVHPILRLTKTAGNDQYGFTENDPVKVGKGPVGGSSNQRDYLDLLRDAQGKAITYVRVGSCCPYKSENGLVGGQALLDKYEIIYLDENGDQQTAIVYISFYDYEEPKILYGFKTVGQK